MTVASVEFMAYDESVTKALDEIGAAEAISRHKAVMVKPNLITNSPPPVTTPPECCEAIVDYVRRHSAAEVVIAEGCGAPSVETAELFDALGYRKLSERLGVPLVDLNTAGTKRLADDSCEVFPEMHLPEIAFTHYVISVPVLKAHSLADITGSMKNMLGLPPPEHYQTPGHWKKAAFHRNMHTAIIELCRYRAPDLTVMDATVGLVDYHLGGRRLDPPANRILAGYDAREVDRLAADLLGLDWHAIPHLAGEWKPGLLESYAP
jgi:uncharacterized protein (DUF362 family)